jgi:hypothetical protein
MKKKQSAAQFWAEYYADKTRIQRLIEGTELDFFCDKTVTPFQAALRECEYRKKLNEKMNKSKTENNADVKCINVNTHPTEEIDFATFVASASTTETHKPLKKRKKNSDKKITVITHDFF